MPEASRPDPIGEPSPKAVTRLAAWAGVLLLLALFASVGHAQSQYVRPVDAAPSAEDIGAGYVTPAVQRPLPRSDWLRALDVGLLGAALIVSAWVVLRRRSRNVLVILTIGCVLYFGFYRKGCICPIGAIQNVAVALTDPGYAIPYLVIAVFFLPLIMALLFGRVYCGGVCPLGGIQELVLLKPVQVPRRLDKWLSLLRYVYLILAIWYAVQPSAERDFIICRFDPFVGLFRRAGTAEMLSFGGALLLIAVFVGRPYCRYLCPYGGILSLLSRLSWRGVTVTPSDELDCGLCAESCPYGAIEKMRAVRSACLFCARCFAFCPVHRAQRKDAGAVEAAHRGET